MKTSNFFSLLLLFLSLNLSISAQETTSSSGETLAIGTPETVGISAERLEKIDAMLEKAMAEEQIPGAVALVARNGRIVYHKAFGQASDDGTELQKDAIFRIASQTKAITATAVMMLWEEGHFQLDDPISKYIPEFANVQVLKEFNPADSSYTGTPAKTLITIRHLLTHTSGLGYGMIDGDERMRKIYQKAGIVELFTTDDINIGDNTRKLAALPLHHEPGERFTYSLGLDVLGYFVEVISGQAFDEFLRTRIFDPIGMDDTWFYLPKSKTDRLVAIQEKKDGEWKNYPSTFYDPNYPASDGNFFSGGAGLSSTALDYANFLQMYLNKGNYNGNLILSPTTIEIMMTNQIGDLWRDANQYYGLAFGIVTEAGVARGGQGSKGTFDWGGYFNTQYFADPQEQVIGILMKQTQGNTGDQTAWKFRQMVMASVAE